MDINLQKLVRGIVLRIALLLAGCGALIVAVWININAGHEILAGLLSPESPGAITTSVVRLLAPVPGLWLIYCGLR
jgi:hypothetical protein